MKRFLLSGCILLGCITYPDFLSRTSCRAAPFRSFIKPENASDNADRRPIKTKSNPAGGNSDRRTASRSRRFIRFRSTAFPFFFVTVKPKRFSAFSSPRETACSTKARLLAAAPLAQRRKSARFKSRSISSSHSSQHASFISRHHESFYPIRVILCAQLFTAARATCRDNFAATNSGHAAAKSVTTFTHEFRGLICPFHERNPPVFQLRKARRPFLLYYTNVLWSAV